jgi:hypothetical protein
MPTEKFRIFMFVKRVGCCFGRVDVSSWSFEVCRGEQRKDTTLSFKTFKNNWNLFFNVFQFYINPVA